MKIGWTILGDIFITGRKFIGAGTFVNAIFLGYIATFFHSNWLSLFGEPQLLWQRVVIVAIGVVVCSFGVSLYQTLVSALGLGPIIHFFDVNFTEKLLAKMRTN
ncbi:hypothetical protein [Paenibacillus pseudetheri]|uniref:Uncharacterized protein n=1 Tax=Paenibacillus pseudetheri TaxID=2897682 RepID=A0ABN8FNL0_9BACL|nr:hypothetical protein [Paenibacillus pseudetheri]CAH1057435.1 hypothetical protein PAECIP111894_03593 [Paenibacillus pseudetheri]